MMHRAWTIARRNLARNRRRNLTTGIAIGLGFAAMIAMAGYTNRLQNYLRVYTIYGTRVGHLSIYQKDGLQEFARKPREASLSPRDQRLLRDVLQAVGGIALDGPQLIGTGLIGNGCKTLPFVATGIDPKLDDRLRLHPEVTRWAPALQDHFRGQPLSAYPAEFGGMALAHGLARLLGKNKVLADFSAAQPPLVIVDCQAPDAKQQIAADANVQLLAASWSGMTSALDGEVIAHYNTGVTETDNIALLTTLAHLQKLLDTNHVSSWSVWLDEPHQLAAKRAELQERLAAAGLDVDIYEWTDERVSPFYSGTMEFVKVMVTFTLAVLATIIVLSIFNAQTMTILERSQEIGMMRSLGYTQRQVRSLFIREMLLLTALALLGGGLVAALVLMGVNALGLHIHPPGIAGGMKLLLVPNLSFTLAALALIVLLAVGTTVLAIGQVSRRNIALLLCGTKA